MIGYYINGIFLNAILTICDSGVKIRLLETNDKAEKVLSFVFLLYYYEIKL
jgi:hypothetical protein